MSDESPLPPFLEHGAVVDVLPELTVEAAGVETVLLRITVRTDPSATAATLPVPPLSEVYVVAGRFDILAVGHFDDRSELNALLADLSADPNVTAVAVDTALRTACEADADGLLSRDRE